MASFNPADAIPVEESEIRQKKFNPADALPYKEPSVAQKILDILPESFYEMADVGQGARAGLQNTAAFLTKPLPESMRVPHFEPQGFSRHSTIPIAVGEIASSLVPGGVAEKATASALDLAPRVPSLFQRGIQGAAGGAASSPAVDATPESGAIIGGVLGAAPEALYGGVRKMFGKNVTPEQFQRARDIIPDGIKAPVGEMTNSPTAKNLYKSSESIALSGAKTPYKQMYNYLSGRMKGLLGEGSDLERPNHIAYDDMKSKYLLSKERTKAAYDDLERYAKETPTEFKRQAYDDQLNQSIKEIEGKIFNKTTRKLYGEVLSALKDFKGTFKEKSIPSKYSKILDKNGNKIEILKPKKANYSLLHDAISIRPAVNELIEEAGKKDDMIALRAFKKLKSGLDKSIEDSAKENPAIINLHNKAKSARIEQGGFENLNINDESPFYKIYKKNGDPANFIPSYIKSSNKGGDNAELLRNLTRYLSDDSRKSVARAIVKPKEETSLQKQLVKISKMTRGERDALFGKESHIAHEAAQLSDTFPSIKSADFTPQTGLTGAKTLQTAAGGAGLGSALVSYLSHNPSYAAAAIAATSALPLLGYSTQKALRSNALKNAIAKSLEAKPGTAITKPTRKGAAIRSALTKSIGGDNSGS